MITFQHKVWFVSALVVSVALGAAVGHAVSPASASTPAAPTNDSGGHSMTPEEQCRHMPEMCPESGGNQSVRS